MCLDNCTSLTYQFANCILDIICDGNVMNSIPMENASITGSDSKGITIQSCCGQVLALSTNNLTELGLSLATLQLFRAQCSAAALASVDYEASNYTILCDSADSNIYYLTYFTYNDGLAEHHFITMPSGLDSVGMPPVTALPCKDPKIIQKCWRVQNGTSYDYYTELICLVNGVVIGDLYLNHQDNSISTTKPLNAEPCEDELKDIESISWLPICVDGVQWYVADVIEYNLSQNTNTPNRIYKQGADGIIVTTPPIGAITDGACAPCIKEIFATHDRYFLASSIPSNLTAYQLTSTLADNGGNATNMYLHLIYGILTGNTVEPPLGSDLQDYFATTHTGVLFTDISTIQSIVDAILPQIGLSVGDAIYAVNTDNEPIWFLSQSAINELTNSTYLHIYFGADSTWNSYTQKADVSVLATNSNILLGGSGYTCINVQEIKEKDTCTGLETYRFVTEDGNGNLVDASTLSGWDETKLLSECPKLLEKEICATIDGSTDSYYLDMVYILDPFTADVIPVKYFDKKGNEVTGVIERVCCTCNTLCEIVTNNNPIPNIKCAGYAGSFDPNLSQSSFMQGFGRYSQSFWDSSCGAGTVTGFTWELDSFIHNGVEQLTSPMIVTVPFSSMTLTASGVPTNYADAFNVLLNTKGINLDPDMAVKSYVNGDTFVLAFRQYANPIACSDPPNSRLEIVTESGDGWEYMPIASPTLAQIQAFTAAGNFTSLVPNSACQSI